MNTQKPANMMNMRKETNTTLEKDFIAKFLFCICSHVHLDKSRKLAWLRQSVSFHSYQAGQILGCQSFCLEKAGSLLSEQRGGTWHVTTSHNEPLNGSGIPPTSYTLSWLPWWRWMIHLPSIFYFFIQSWGQQQQQRVQLSRPHSAHLAGTARRFPGQQWDAVPLACPGSSLGLLPVGHAWKHLSREACKNHSEKMPQLHQLVPLNV